MKPAAALRRRGISATLIGAGASVWSGIAWSIAAQTQASAAVRPIRLALIGDVPYGRHEEQRLLEVFDDLATQADLAIHVGDIKGSGEPCSNALLERRISLLDRCPIPLVYTPGDNEWLDCWREKAGGFDPEERLDWLRRRIFMGRLPTLGRAPGASTGLDAIEQQSRVDGGPPENLRWQAGGACWITLNLPGSNNGLGASIADEHRLARDRANRRWLEASIASARDAAASAMIVAVQANPRFERRARPGDRPGAPTLSSEDGYASFRADLFRTQREFGKPMLLLHGDTHRFRHDWITPGLLRVECFGSPFAQSWVKIEIDATTEPPFRVSVRHLWSQPR
jgi:hypothetical protein